MQKSIAMNNSFPICYETHGNPNHPCIILILGIGGQLIQWPKTLIDGLVKEFDVIMLMDKLSIQKAHILGGSMGGMIAEVFAIEYPQRILSLILIATTSGDPHLSPTAASVLQFFSLSTSEK